MVVCAPNRLCVERERKMIQKMPGRNEQVTTKAKTLSFEYQIFSPTILKPNSATPKRNNRAEAMTTCGGHFDWHQPFSWKTRQRTLCN